MQKPTKLVESLHYMKGKQTLTFFFQVGRTAVNPVTCGLLAWSSSLCSTASSLFMTAHPKNSSVKSRLQSTPSQSECFSFTHNTLIRKLTVCSFIKGIHSGSFFFMKCLQIILHLKDLTETFFYCSNFLFLVLEHIYYMK